MYCRWRISYQKVGVPLTGLTLPHFCACPNPETWFSIVICRGLSVFSELSSNGSNCFVDIGGIVDHHCLEVIVSFLDIGGIVDQHGLEVIVRFVDIGGIVNHHYLEIIVCFVEINGIVDHHCLEMTVRFVDWCELLTISMWR